MPAEPTAPQGPTLQEQLAVVVTQIGELTAQRANTDSAIAQLENQASDLRQQIAGPGN